ncbi:Uma2 family endonuclease [Candidatus Thiosymbion oneisti]|uniref:Uma2 family endonuclease n=1 Tax=Candidatus Thiosymbion oneisti TaxID=589554 RepID=UPI00105CF8DA|nr:Uma2 family endonuclease [Candidatus Thiosymbion oneisti]
MLNSVAQLPQHHPISVREYFRMGETDVLDPEARCELIEGELFDMPPIGPPHSSKVKRLIRSFSRIIGDQAIVSAQDPILLGDFSAPQPDLALLRWREDFYEQVHPGPDDILVLVEVADSTLTYDRDRKLPLYARFAIPEVWLVDVAGRQLDVHRDPESGKYKTKFQVQDLSCVGIAALPDIELNLRSLF